MIDNKLLLVKQLRIESYKLIHKLKSVSRSFQLIIRRSCNIKKNFFPDSFNFFSLTLKFN